jgi:hypothetical protein
VLAKRFLGESERFPGLLCFASQALNLGGAGRSPQTPHPEPGRRERNMSHTVQGAGFARSMAYFSIASSTFAAGTAPSSASALSAATVT